MAQNTWHSSAQAVTYAANKYMIDVFNGSSSTRAIRVYRIWLFNNQTSAVTGALNPLQIWRTVAASGGTTITPVAHDPNNSALNANTTSGNGRTITTDVMLRQILSQNDEPSVTTLDMDALLTLVPYCELWNSGYGDTNVQPLTAPAGLAYGYALKSITVTTGVADVEMEFTDAAS